MVKADDGSAFLEWLAGDAVIEYDDPRVAPPELRPASQERFEGVMTFLWPDGETVTKSPTARWRKNQMFV